MRILALITARGGSKRLPGKNIRQLGGSPLLVWSITAATGIQDICDILVSTDDQEILDVARQAGALAPWLRPKELATDTAKSIDVALHALDWYEESHGVVDGLMLLQPTSPFRSAETIRQAIRLFIANERRPVVGISAATSHPVWCYRIENNFLMPYFKNGDTEVPHRVQDLPPAFIANGAIYLAEPAYLRKTGTFEGTATCPLLMENPFESLDIDTAHDFLMAECIAASLGTSTLDPVNFTPK